MQCSSVPCVLIFSIFSAWFIFGTSTQNVQNDNRKQNTCGHAPTLNKTSQLIQHPPLFGDFKKEHKGYTSCWAQQRISVKRTASNSRLSWSSQRCSALKPGNILLSELETARLCSWLAENTQSSELESPESGLGSPLTLQRWMMAFS